MTLPQMPEAAQLPTEAQRAFWLRALAVIIDSLVLSLMSFGINAVFGVTHVTSGSPIPLANGSIATFTSSTDVGWGWLLLVVLVYYIGLEALFGATVGKWLVNLRVTDLDGRRAGVGAIVVRNVMRLVDGLPVGFLVGGTAALSSPRRQRLGDRLAHTLVVRREALTAPLLTPAQRRWRVALVGGVVVTCLAFSGAFFYYGRSPLVVQSMMNTRQMMFQHGVRSYTLSAPVWGSGTVSYQIEYVTEQPVDTCHAHLTLAWELPNGWEPRYGEATCGAHTP
ncbi:MAG TPA: RDD family protein [Ktedonobacterales bacterium]